MDTSFFFPYRRLLKQFLIEIAKKEGKKVDLLQYIFCSDEYLKKLNKRYLKHNSYTDIITFPFSSTTEPILADAYISTDRVRDNATHYQTSFERELHRVVFHGLLHLCGYSDNTCDDARLIREKEDDFINKFLFHVKQLKAHPDVN
ncbi:MAG: rRNA maturation RNase YbeY [Chitinophagaceae bacterium]